MQFTEVVTKMSAYEFLSAILGALVCLSVASERLVEIIKGLIPFLNQQHLDNKKEGLRKSLLQAMSVGSGILTAFLAKPALAEVLPSGWYSLPAIVGLGFLASGGSGLWNSILTWVLNIKNLKKEEAVELHRKNASA
jgi:hypothetical protein